MRFVCLCVAIFLVLLTVVSVGMSKAEFTKKESKPCTYCHPAGKFKELTEAGKYYKGHNYSLEGYKEAERK